MIVKIWKGYWTLQDVQDNDDFIFIFGDNDVRVGKGGQAIIRGEKNAMGIPTKKYPGYNPKAYYTDTEISTNKIKIDNAINNIVYKLKNNNAQYKGIILPEDGLGTGLADLKNKAPETFGYLNKKIKELTNICIKL